MKLIQNMYHYNDVMHIMFGQAGISFEFHKTSTYIAQKESRFPEGRISSRRNDVNKGRAARFLAYS